MPFRLFIAAYAILGVVCYTTYIEPFGAEIDALVTLVALLTLSCLLLWQRGDVTRGLDLRGRNWADRIEIERRGPAEHGQTQ